MPSVQDVLRPIVITKTVSRLAATTSSFLTGMGMAPGGPLERVVGGREASYDVFSNVRTVGTPVSPGNPARRRARNPTGRVPFVFPRMYEEVFLLGEEIHNLRAIGGPSSARDEAGAQYIAKQMLTPAQRLANFRCAMLVGTLRNSLYVAQSGDQWYFTYTSGGSLFQVPSQIPSGNLGQLNMLGAGNILTVGWQTSTTNIPSHLDNINKAFLQLCGSRLERIKCGSAVWNNVCNNDFIRNQAGTVNPPFTTYARQVGTGPDGMPINAFMGRIASKPWIEWEITDEGLDLGVPGSEVFTPHIAVDAAMFLPGSSPIYTEMLLGSEPIAEYDNGPWSVKTGAASWTKTSSNPTGWEIFVLDNALPVLYVPAAFAYGTVVF